MDERGVKALALACSVAGLAVLYLSSAVAEQSSAPVGMGALSIDDAGSGAKICGNVTDFRTSKGNVFFRLHDSTGSMRVVIFNATAVRMNVSPAQGSLCVLGQVQEYPAGSGEMELVAKKVIK